MSKGKKSGLIAVGTVVLNGASYQDGQAIDAADLADGEAQWLLDNGAAVSGGAQASPEAAPAPSDGPPVD